MRRAAWHTHHMQGGSQNISRAQPTARRGAAQEPHLHARASGTPTDRATNQPITHRGLTHTRPGKTIAGRGTPNTPA